MTTSDTMKENPSSDTATSEGATGRQTADERDDAETLEAIQSRWAARPTGQGTTFRRLWEHLGLYGDDERAALSASIQRLIAAGKVDRVPGTDAERFRLRESLR